MWTPLVCSFVVSLALRKVAFVFKRFSIYELSWCPSHEHSYARCILTLLALPRSIYVALRSLTDAKPDDQTCSQLASCIWASGFVKSNLFWTGVVALYLFLLLLERWLDSWGSGKLGVRQPYWVLFSFFTLLAFWPLRFIPVSVCPLILQLPSFIQTFGVNLLGSKR